MRILTRIVDWFAAPCSLYLLIRDPLVSWKTKLKAGLALAAVSFYILNPFDIIPDFTPVMGWIDDLLIVPAFLFLAGKIVPEISLSEIRQKARSRTRRVMFWTLASAFTLILVFLSTPGLLIFLAVKTWA
jgi:uncharacterized membrane protein YkvA (DUF1232 family)